MANTRITVVKMFVLIFGILCVSKQILASRGMYLFSLNLLNYALSLIRYVSQRTNVKIVTCDIFDSLPATFTDQCS